MKESNENNWEPRVKLRIGVELETSSKLSREQFKALLPSGWGAHGDGTIPGGGHEAASCRMTEADVFQDNVVEQTIARLLENGCSFREPRVAYVVTDGMQQCCSMHVHLGILGNRKQHMDPKIKGVARAVYSHYYKEIEEGFVAPCRRKGGAAHGYCKIYHPSKASELRLPERATQYGTRYQAVNTTSEFRTIEFRQGAVIPSSPVSANQWIALVVDIMRGAWQITHFAESPTTVQDLKAILPATLADFRQQVYALHDNPKGLVPTLVKPRRDEPGKPAPIPAAPALLTGQFLSLEALKQMRESS